MGQVSGGGISLTRQISNEMGQALKSSSSDDNVFRVKVGKGDLIFLADQGAQGNWGSRTINKGELINKQANNLAAGYLALQLYAQQGSSGAKVDEQQLQDMTQAFKTKLMDRKVSQTDIGLHVSDARKMFEQGQMKDALRDLPHSSMSELTQSLPQYLAQGDFGAALLHERLDSLDFSKKENADALRNLTVGSGQKMLDGHPTLKQELTEKWIDVRATSIASQPPSHPPGQDLVNANNRLKSFSYKSSPELAKPDSRIPPDILAAVTLKVVEMRAQQAGESGNLESMMLQDFEKVTQGNPELANNPQFKAAYLMNLAQASSNKELSETDLDMGMGIRYEAVQPGAVDSALSKAGLQPETKAGATFDRLMQFYTFPKELAKGDNHLPFQKTVGKTVISQKHSISINGQPVNASHVKSASGVNMIATNGPNTKLGSVDAFFQTMVQENVDTLVNLTRMKEQPVMLEYIPSQPNQTLTVGNNKITLLNQTGHISQVQIETPSGSKTLNIARYPNWPDHGVATPKAMLDFCREVGSSTPSTMATHCFAGVGRTGTFDSCFDVVQMIDDGRITNMRQLTSHVNDLIKTNRQQRGTAWVQTAAQHELIYQVGQMALEQQQFANGPDYENLPFQNREQPSPPPPPRKQSLNR
ncbi:tyrosine-protein phosphatase [Parendozoicomonas haliclonae]|uniref:Protein-tyrosine phosphatase n=1 Tax=Parendozoicomonas haliclonae TaxID=1960125 RepID=A0A1X7AM78_9GAMM|nr:tyrosine-protein phosphatase [Parendozoicomonas haliclonae]SMA48999.1 Protein-tyrosine phosphatase [Parendozoicomonas haliclonae]